MSNNIYKKLMLVQSENGCSNKDDRRFEYECL